MLTQHSYNTLYTFPWFLLFHTFPWFLLFHGSHCYIASMVIILFDGSPVHCSILTYAAYFHVFRACILESLVSSELHALELIEYAQ